jgi:serine protease Do
MKLKFLFAPLFLLILVAGASAQIRDYIFVVRPVYDPSVEAFLDDVSGSLKERGYSDLADHLSGSSGKRFGSGYLYVTEDGSEFILTNRHVLSGAASALLEQEQEDGSLSKLENNSITAMDDGLDLAIVRLSRPEPSAAGLALTDSAPVDGTDVWSAGYPGLAGDPSWQFGKGNITNARARVEELIDPDKSTLIQHSAPVDPGNSGGPLLIEAPSENSGYLVAGINTWKAFSRQAANFAVPSITIRGFLENTFSDNSEAERTKRLEIRSGEFSGLFSEASDMEEFERIDRIARFISMEYVTEAGEAALVEVLQSAPGNIRSAVIKNIAEASPIEGFRLAIAYTIDRNLSGTAVLSPPRTMPAPIPAESGSTLLAFPSGNAEDVETAWKEEFGSWRIVSLESSFGEDTPEKEESRGTSKITFEAPYAVMFFAEYSMIKDLTSLWVGGFGYAFHQYASFGSTIGIGSIEVDDGFSISKTPLIRVLFFGRVQYPVVSDYFFINPFAELRGGIQISPEGDDLSGLLGSWGAGVQIGYNYSSRTNFFLGLAWNREDQASIMSEEESGGGSRNAITISLGIGLL